MFLISEIQRSESEINIPFPVIVKNPKISLACTNEKEYKNAHTLSSLLSLLSLHQFLSLGFCVISRGCLTRSISSSRRPTPEPPKLTLSRPELSVRTDTLLSKAAPARLWKSRPPKPGSTVMPSVILLPLTSSLPRSLRILSHLLTIVMFPTSTALITSSLTFPRMDLLVC